MYLEEEVLEAWIHEIDWQLLLPPLLFILLFLSPLPCILPLLCSLFPPPSLISLPSTFPTPSVPITSSLTLIPQNYSSSYLRVQYSLAACAKNLLCIMFPWKMFLNANNQLRCAPAEQWCFEAQSTTSVTTYSIMHSSRAISRFWWSWSLEIIWCSLSKRKNTNT